MKRNLAAGLVLFGAIPLLLACGPGAPSTSAGRTPQSSASNPSDSSAGQPGAKSAGQGPAAVTGVQEYAVPRGSGPHDVAPAADGGVWFTAQRAGALGRLDPATGETRMVPLGQGSAPHGVILGPDGALWVTDGGLNAIVRVDPATQQVRTFPLPASRPRTDLNTSAFDRQGRLWFTGQAGIYGRLDPTTGEMAIFDAPKGPGPYGITVTPDGGIFFASLAGSYVGRIDAETGAATALDPPTAGQGARRAWTDSSGHVWVSEWNAGQVARYDPATGQWREWKLPGDKPHAYAVYVDRQDEAWLSDWGSNSIVRFDPVSGRFDSFRLPTSEADVRQIAGRPGEVWAAESGADKLVVLRTGSKAAHISQRLGMIVGLAAPSP